jgi:SAM-dependent methyltransferase
LLETADRHFLHRGYGVEFDMEAAWIRRHLPRSSGPLLEVGCGIGALFDLFGPTLTVGVDGSAAGLRETRKRHPSAALVCGDAAELPFADGHFDAVMLQHVIEHLQDAQAACEEWFRVLKSGGRLLLLTPNRLFSDPTAFEDDTHVRILRHDELAAMVEEAGFEVLDLRTLGLPWFCRYQRWPSGWRLRRWVTHYARSLSRISHLRWKGQTLCCAARRPLS